MRELLLIAQRDLSTTERFVILPLFALFGVAMILIGLNAIKNKRIGARRSERVLYGKTEWTGGMAVVKGVVLCVGGVAIIIGVAVMFVMKKTLLPG